MTKRLILPVLLAGVAAVAFRSSAAPAEQKAACSLQPSAASINRRS